MAAAPQHKSLHLIVTQSVDQDVPDFTNPVRTLLATFRQEHSHAFKKIEHIPVPIEKEDTSFTNDLKLYGNKKNSMNNLMGGLQRAVDLIQTSAPSNVMVMEDDVVLSCDALEYFSYASKRMDVDRKEIRPLQEHCRGRLEVASLELLTRPSFFIGNRDTHYFLNKQRDRSPSATITITANSRTVVKTYAWMLSHSYVQTYLVALRNVNPIEGSGGSRVSKSGKVGVDDPSGTLKGCYFCEPYCYDHVAEWTLAKGGHRVMYPSVPRVTQTEGSGMTYATNPITPIFTQFINEEHFNRNGLSKYGELIMNRFDLPGSSAWMNHGPTVGYYVLVGTVFMFVVLVCVAMNKINRILSNKKLKRTRIKRR